MAFTEEYIQPQQWDHFLFFETIDADGAYTGSVNPGFKFKLGEIRLHFSVAFASTEDLVVRLSSNRGSAHNLTLISQALNGVQDYLYQFDKDMIFESADQIIITTSQVSANNVAGLTVAGWAVQGTT